METAVRMWEARGALGTGSTGSHSKAEGEARGREPTGQGSEQEGPPPHPHIPHQEHTGRSPWGGRLAREGLPAALSPAQHPAVSQLGPNLAAISPALSSSNTTAPQQWDRNK